MLRNRHILPFVLMALTLGTGSASAGNRDYGLGLSVELGAGVLGGGEVSAAIQLNRFLSLRGQAHFLSEDTNRWVTGQVVPLLRDQFGVSLDLSQYGLDLARDTRLNMDDYGIMLDIHPFGGSFRITGGYAYGPNRSLGMFTTGAQIKDAPIIDEVLETAINSLNVLTLSNEVSPLLIQGFGVDDLNTTITQISTDVTTGLIDEALGKVNTINAGIAFEPWMPYVGIGWTGPILGRLGMFFNIGCYLAVPSQSKIYINADIEGGTFDYGSIVQTALEADPNLSQFVPADLGTSLGGIDYTQNLVDLQNEISKLESDLQTQMEELFQDIGLPVVPIPTISVGLTFRFF